MLEDSTGMWPGQMDDEGSTGDKTGGAFLLDDFKYPMLRERFPILIMTISTVWRLS